MWYTRVMETNNSNINTEANLNNVCPVCHQSILPIYYFCPNCGTKLSSAPLSTSIMTQLGIYLFSIILPMIAFLLVMRWPGLKYSRSSDSKTKAIGIVAWILLIISTFAVIWLSWWSYIALQQSIQSSLNILNADFGSFGL